MKLIIDPSDDDHDSEDNVDNNFLWQTDQNIFSVEV